MPTGKKPKGAKGTSFSPMSPRKKEETVREQEPKVVPIGRFQGDEEYRKLKERAEQPSDALDQGGQHDPAVADEVEE